MISDKINLTQIIKAHAQTLRDVNSQRISLLDYFYLLFCPLILSVLASIFLDQKTDAYLTAIIAIYAIFSALLINAQIALYTIFQSWSKPVQSGSDTKNSRIRASKSNDGRRLMAEVNSNLSYMVVIAALALFLTILFVMANIATKVEVFISVLFLSHFLLTLMMVIKRMFLIFNAEFQT